LYADQIFPARSTWLCAGLSSPARELLPDEGLGALVLLGFLCCTSLRSRFAGISDVQRGMYVTSVVLAVLAAAPLLAPAA